MAAIYAVYKGEDLLMTGTAKEIAEAEGVSLKTVYWRTSPTNAKRDGGKRKILVRIDEESDE